MHQADDLAGNLVNLADHKYGSAVPWANDDFFASKDNLVLPTEAIFIADKFTPRGKWMDGWESRRRREPGHDTCIVRLGLPGEVDTLIVDTAHFRGNFPRACAFDVASVDEHTTLAELLADESLWTPLVAETPLEGNSKNRIQVPPGNAGLRATHLRFHIFPDGGVARLRVLGRVLPAPRILGRIGSDTDIDLAAVEHGGLVIACNDMFFGSRHNLLGPGRAVNMGDGWETKRSRKEAPDWCIVQLGVEGVIREAEIDTLYFVGNFPESAALFAVDAAGRDVTQLADAEWKPLLARTKLEAHRRHLYEDQLAELGPVTHVKMLIWPDGGVSRLRLRGTPSERGRDRLGLAWLQALSPRARQRALHGCCHSSAFAEQLAAEGPFSTRDELYAAARRVWRGLRPTDWEEAFAGHPRIGERRAHDVQASREQRGVQGAAPEVLAELARVNEEYERKFGRVYLVCATGKSAEQMLELAQARLQRSPAEELETAASEQEKITELRLAKLLFRS